MTKEFEEALNETVNKFADVILQATKEPKNATNLTNAVNYLERTPQIRALRKCCKAWGVVKEKNVDVALIRLCKDSGEYNGEITLQDEWWHRKLLTEEEFDLLKEMTK